MENHGMTSSKDDAPRTAEPNDTNSTGSNEALSTVRNFDNSDGDTDKHEIHNNLRNADMKARADYDTFSIPIDDNELDAKSKPTANTFAAKKTVAQGMMDIALITANANQLRYIVEFTSETRTYYLNLTLIVISLLLQVAVGVSLIFKGKYDMKGMTKSVQARRINNYVVVAVFLITIINVFIASFTTTNPPRVLPYQAPLPPALVDPMSMNL